MQERLRVLMAVDELHRELTMTGQSHRLLARRTLASMTEHLRALMHASSRARLRAVARALLALALRADHVTLLLALVIATLQRRAALSPARERSELCAFDEHSFVLSQTVLLQQL